MDILHEDQSIFLIMSSTVLLRMGNVSDKSCRKNQHTFDFQFFFFKLCFIWDNVEKHFRASQATDDNMAHAFCMLNT